MAAKKRKKKWIYILPVIALVGVGGWYAYARTTQTEEAEVQLAEVTRGDIETTISAAGKIQPKETVEVGAQVSGQLEKIYVEEGDIVEQGQLLAQIDATIAETNVEAQRAQLKELYASRDQQEANLNLATSEAARAQILYDADAISKAEYESATAALAISKAQKASIAAQIERQTSSLNADLAELAFTKIYAPVSGTVVSLSANEGQTLNANQTAPTILTLADLTVMTVETDVSEADVLSVYPGEPAYFSTLGDSSRKWDSVVRQILPTPEVVNDVVLYKALLDVANPDGLLRTEMTTQVFFITGQAENALLVPLMALQGAQPRKPPGAGAPPQGQGAQGGPPPGMQGLREAKEANPDATMDTVMVWDASTETSHPQPVLVGLKTRSQAEILFGLKEGQKVVSGQVMGGGAGAGQFQGGRPPGGGFAPPVRR